MTPIEYCALGAAPCWTRAEWISLWSGIVGAAAAFLLATAYQAMKRVRDAKTARRNWTIALMDLSRKLNPFFEGSVDDPQWKASPIELREAAFAITKARAALNWSIGHPEYFKFDQWAELQEAQQVLEIWYQQCNKWGGFAAGLYQGEITASDTITLARGMKYLLHIPED